MGGLMMKGGGPLHLHGCVFGEQSSNNYAHITLEQVTAAVDYCSMDASAGLDVQSIQGHLTQRSEAPQEKDSHGDALSSVLAEIHQVIGMSASKQVMETLLHQAPARLWEWLLGSLILGPLLAVIIGIFIFVLADAVQNRQKTTQSSQRNQRKQTAGLKT